MKKFEEELKIIPVMGREPIRNQSLYSKCDIIELSNGWVSPEDHQAEIGKIELQNLKYREEIARMQKSLRKKNKAIKELNAAVKKIKLDRDEWKTEANQLDKEKDRLITETEQLKSQIGKQQPEIPEFVATEIERLKSEGIKTLCDFYNCDVDWMTFGMEDLRGDELAVAKWFYHNTETFELAYSYGYTVAKEKRFYLKDKNTKLYLWKDLETPEPPLIGVSFNDKHLDESNQFTQQEIDSMETGSYEQIEVQE